jgi:nucleotide-binding universal stress UspA family protein
MNVRLSDALDDTKVGLRTLLVGDDHGDLRVAAVAEALAERVGADLVHVSDRSPPPGDLSLPCVAVGLEVTEDEVLLEHLARPGSDALVVGPHCSGQVMLDGPVVVTFDGSDRAAAVFPVARWWAHHLDVPIVLAHMWAPIDALDHGSEIFGAVRTALAELGPSAQFEPVHTSYPAGAIRELAHELDASLIAMSSLGAEARPDSVIGHVAARVIRESPCPVLLHHPPVERARA